MELIETAPHEFAAHFLFAEHGLAPFFACDRRIEKGGGSQTGAFEFAGEQWGLRDDEDPAQNGSGSAFRTDPPADPVRADPALDGRHRKVEYLHSCELPASSCDGRILLLVIQVNY